MDAECTMYEKYFFRSTIQILHTSMMKAIFYFLGLSIAFLGKSYIALPKSAQNSGPHPPRSVGRASPVNANNPLFYVLLGVCIGYLSAPRGLRVGKEWITMTNRRIVAEQKKKGN